VVIGVCDAVENKVLKRCHNQSALAINLMNRYEKIELESHRPKNGVHQDPREIVPRQFLTIALIAINATIVRTVSNAARIPVRHAGR